MSAKPYVWHHTRGRAVTRGHMAKERHISSKGVDGGFGKVATAASGPTRTRSGETSPLQTLQILNESTADGHSH